MTNSDMSKNESYSHLLCVWSSVELQSSVICYMSIVLYCIYIDYTKSTKSHQIHSFCKDINLETEKHKRTENGYN